MCMSSCHRPSRRYGCNPIITRGCTALPMMIDLSAGPDSAAGPSLASEPSLSKSCGIQAQASAHLCARDCEQIVLILRRTPPGAHAQPGRCRLACKSTRHDLELISCDCNWTAIQARKPWCMLATTSGPRSFSIVIVKLLLRIIGNAWTVSPAAHSPAILECKVRYRCLCMGNRKQGQISPPEPRTDRSSPSQRCRGPFEVCPSSDSACSAGRISSSKSTHH